MHYAALLCDLKPAQPMYVCPHLNLHLIYRPQMHCRAVFFQRIKKCELRAVQCRVNCVQNAIILFCDLARALEPVYSPPMLFEFTNAFL